MDSLIVLKFKWECNKCANVVETKIQLDEAPTIKIRPAKKCICGTPGRQYGLLGVEKLKYEVENQ